MFYNILLWRMLEEQKWILGWEKSFHDTRMRIDIWGVFENEAETGRGEFNMILIWETTCMAHNWCGNGGELEANLRNDWGFRFNIHGEGPSWFKNLLHYTKWLVDLQCKDYTGRATLKINAKQPAYPSWTLHQHPNYNYVSLPWVIARLV